MHTILKATLLALPPLAGFAVGCSSNGPPENPASASAAIVTITSVPPGVSCIEVRVSGGTDEDQLFGASAGQNEAFALNGLAAGANTFAAFAYPGACSSVESTTAATWISNSTQAVLVAGQIGNVSLTLVPASSVEADGGSEGDADTGTVTSPEDAGAHDAEGGPPPQGDGSTSIAPLNFASATIYSVYVPIFSSGGNLAGVTSQLSQIRSLGFNVLYLLPVTAAGTSTATPVSSCNQGAEGSIGSPYEVKDYDSIDPTLGASQDLVTLVSTAHGLGMYVILDEVLNHTSWDNALITQHPEYYLHCDGNRSNAGSIEIGAYGNGSFEDVAQLDYITTPDVGLRPYIINMLVSQLQTYDVDGFRFDTADDPYGSSRLIPLDFWESVRAQLEATKPGLLMLGEEEDPDLAQTAFDLDYGWHLDGVYTPPAGGLQQVAGSGASAADPASLLEQGWTYQKTGYPATMLHLSLLQDWDLAEDLTLYGGVAGTMAAAAFDFTIDGVPMIFNGEEVGNDNSGFNTHTKIDWNSPNAGTFTPFYKSLLALRNANTALQQGSLTWLTNSASGQVVSYSRSDSNGTFLVVINFSNGQVSGTVSAVPTESAWTDVSPTGSPGGTSHPTPPSFSLAAYDFAVYQAN
jgi:cyclomaltodextrinase / maltogenic alpha-amylase / neopullulanase